MASAGNNNSMEDIGQDIPDKPYLSNNNVADNNVTIIPDNPIVEINQKKLTPREKQVIFDMYVRTYTKAGFRSRFRNSDHLFDKYPCMYAMHRYYTRAYVFVQHKQYYNKIVAICHNDKPLGRAILFHIIGTLLRRPGTIMEASGKVSWILRKNNLAPMITDPNIIRIAIGLTSDDTLIINPNYDINNMYNQYYTRILYPLKKGAEETLFGTPVGCIFDTNDCTRQCVQQIDFSRVQGGRYRRKSYKNKRNNRKKTVKRHKKY